MRNFLTARWRPYALAFVVAAASLGVVGACTSLKQPLPPGQCTGNESTGACLKIEPIQWAYTSKDEIHMFKVTNLGPDQSEPLREGIYGATDVFSPQQDNCYLQTPVKGDWCTIGVIHYGTLSGANGYLVVGGDNSQWTTLPVGGGVTQVRGVKAFLTEG
jgi:hypothetical protein